MISAILNLLRTEPPLGMQSIPTGSPVSEIIDERTSTASTSTSNRLSERVVRTKGPPAISPTYTDDTIRSRTEADSDGSTRRDSEAKPEDDSEDDSEDESEATAWAQTVKWTRTVTVQAGRHKAPFKVHKAPLVDKSTFFRKALIPGRWNEGYNALVCLVTISAQYFMMYAHWVYTSQLDFAALGYRQNGDDFVRFSAVLANGSEIEMCSNRDRHLEKTGDWAHRLIRLWIHADFLGDVHLQNTISEELEHWWFDKHLVVTIHERSFAFVGKQTSPNSPLRQLCIDWADLSYVFRSLERRQIEVERLPRWLSSALLLMKLRRERGTLKDDPRKMDLARRGKYHVRCNDCR